MGNFITQLAEQVGGSIPGTLMGMALGRYNDRRQRDQQQALQDMQMKGSKQMMDYQMMKQLEMWQKTGYGPQIEQMKAAGINPALMYGMGGGGAQTIGNQNASLTGANAPVGGREVQDIIGMGLMAAQKRLIEAQAKKTEGETANLPLQGKNIQAQTTLAEIEAKIKGATIEEAIQIVTADMAIKQQQVLQQEVKTTVDRATQNTQIDTIKAQYIALLLGNALTKAQTSTEKGKPALQAQEIESMKKHIENTVLARMQKWREIEITGQNAGRMDRDAIRQLEGDLNDQLKLPFDIIEKVVQAVILKGIINPQPNIQNPFK